MKRKVYGVGINDANYKVQPFDKNCPYYQTWYGILSRCYSKHKQKRQPTYIGCRVCYEWLTFSNFKVWMGKAKLEK